MSAVRSCRCILVIFQVQRDEEIDLSDGLAIRLIAAFPIREARRTAEAVLRRLLESVHIDEGSISSIPREDWEIDLLGRYGAPETGLEDSDDDEDCSPSCQAWRNRRVRARPQVVLPGEWASGCSGGGRLDRS